MIKITKDNQTVIVPNGAYQGVYKRLGWLPVEQEPQDASGALGVAEQVNISAAKENASGELQEAQKVVKDADDSDSVNDVIREEQIELTDDELKLLPVEEMSKEQLARAAALTGVSTAGKKAKQVRAEVRNALEQ